MKKLLFALYLLPAIFFAFPIVTVTIALFFAVGDAFISGDFFFLQSLIGDVISDGAWKITLFLVSLLLAGFGISLSMLLKLKSHISISPLNHITAVIIIIVLSGLLFLPYLLFLYALLGFLSYSI